MKRKQSVLKIRIFNGDLISVWKTLTWTQIQFIQKSWFSSLDEDWYVWRWFISKCSLNIIEEENQKRISTNLASTRIQVGVLLIKKGRRYCGGKSIQKTILLKGGSRTHNNVKLKSAKELYLSIFNTWVKRNIYFIIFVNIFHRFHYLTSSVPLQT